MKKLSILCLAVSLLLTASCSKEDLSNGTGYLYTLTGVVEENTPTTRVGFDLDNNGSFFWNSGDAIAVGASSFAKYTTSCDDKSTSATFTSLSPASGYAVYPWERAQSISGSELTYEFEDEYTYETVDTDFFNGMSVDIPMWAKVEGGTLSFKHLGGVFAFKFPNLKAGNNQVFTLTANSKISGVFTADLSDDEPIFETSTENVQDADKKVIINFSLESDADAVFYVPVPIGTYALKVEITNGEASYSQEYKNLAVARRSIRYTTLSSHSLQGAEAKVVESASEVTSVMEENTNVVLNNIESQSANSIVSIELPKKSENSEVAHSLSIGSIDDNTKTIEIKESDSDNEGNSISELVISVPTTEDAKKLVIDMPNTTVSILVNGMNSLTLDEVVASTAESTLIVSKDVTINTLKVRQGNVRIEEGGKVTMIERASENTETVYVVYESATAPEITMGDGVLLMSVAEYEFKKAIDNNATFYQIPDVATLKLFREAVNSGKTFAGCTIELTTTIDLNNEQWSPIGTSENPFKGVFDGKSYTIKNLSIVEEEAKEGKAYIGFFGYASNVTIKNVTFENVNLNIPCLDIDHSQGHIGAVTGSLEGTCTIENVTVKGDIKVEATFDANGASRVAVVAGGNVDGDVTMKNVHVKANEGSYLKANNNVGALAGQLQVTNVFENCSSNIDVTAKKFYAGGIIGLAAGNSTFTDCHTTGDITVTAGREGRHNDEYRVGGIAGGWADGKTKVCTLTNCSYTGTVSGTNADGSVANPLDYAGYVGRGYTLTNCEGSKVTIDGVSYIQAGNTAEYYGKYVVVKDGVYEADDAAELLYCLEKNAESIKLTGDVALTESVTLGEGKTLVLDLNGQTISQTSDTPVSMITNNGNLTIEDSSNGSGKIDFTFNGTVNNGVAANAISNRGTLAVEGGEISNTSTGNQIGYAIDNYNGSTLTVDGGKITVSGSSYYDGIRLFCGSNETTVTVNKGEISSIWAQNPSANKATAVSGTVIINGGTVGTTYYENYTTVKVKSGLTTNVTPYGEGKEDTTTTTEGEYTVYSFVHE